ncbi:hypothetical protein DIPPA_24639 [Diplonema papillatum]|nr:hypothetical protein DIPPA_24639 [Diplonema papillatum]
MAETYLLPTTVAFPANLVRGFATKSSLIYCFAVVNHVSSTGKNRRRVMLCTPTYVLVAEVTGGLKRAFDVQDIDSVGYSGVDTIVIRPKTGCSEPPLLLRVIQNGAVAGSHRLASELAKVIASVATVAQQRPVHDAQGQMPTNAMLKKGPGYVPPPMKIKNGKRGLFGSPLASPHAPPVNPTSSDGVLPPPPPAFPTHHTAPGPPQRAAQPLAAPVPPMYENRVAPEAHGDGHARPRLEPIPSAEIVLPPAAATPRKSAGSTPGSPGASLGRAVDDMFLRSPAPHSDAQSITEEESSNEHMDTYVRRQSPAPSDSAALRGSRHSRRERRGAKKETPRGSAGKKSKFWQQFVNDYDSLCSDWDSSKTLRSPTAGSQAARHSSLLDADGLLPSSPLGSPTLGSPRNKRKSPHLIRSSF